MQAQATGRAIRIRVSNPFRAFHVHHWHLEEGEGFGGFSGKRRVCCKDFCGAMEERWSYTAIRPKFGFFLCHRRMHKVPVSYWMVVRRRGDR